MLLYSMWLDPVQQLHKAKTQQTNQAIKKHFVVWGKSNAADAFKNASYVCLRRGAMQS